MLSGLKLSLLSFLSLFKKLSGLDDVSNSYKKGIGPMSGMDVSHSFDFYSPFIITI